MENDKIRINMRTSDTGHYVTDIGHWTVSHVKIVQKDVKGQLKEIHSWFLVLLRTPDIGKIVYLKTFDLENWLKYTSSYGHRIPDSKSRTLDIYRYPKKSVKGMSRDNYFKVQTLPHSCLQVLLRTSDKNCPIDLESETRTPDRSKVYFK